MHSSIAKFSLLAAASFAAAHGIVIDLDIAGTWYPGSNPYQDVYMNPIPDRVVWPFFGSGNGPVADFTTSAITCNGNATAGALVATIAAGETIDFYWTTWPESHKGPTMTYLANCGGDCRDVDPSTLSYFKINEDGYDSGTWASDKLIANNNSWSVTIPSDIAPGNYLVRHELLALHSAFNTLGAQFYPMCANLKITGSGTATPSGVTFPGAYKTDDAGILCNIYNSFSTYQIPGPTVYGATATASAAEGSTSTVADAAATSAAAETAAAETAAAAETSEASTAESTVADSSVVTSAAAAAAESTVAVATSAAATSAAATTAAAQVTTAAAAESTTLAAVVTSAATQSLNDSEKINQCLDNINKEIASLQPKNGGAVDFSSVEAKRSACYSIA